MAGRAAAAAAAAAASGNGARNIGGSSVATTAVAACGGAAAASSAAASQGMNLPPTGGSRIASMLVHASHCALIATCQQARTQYVDGIMLNFE